MLVISKVPVFMAKERLLCLCLLLFFTINAGKKQDCLRAFGLYVVVKFICVIYIPVGAVGAADGCASGFPDMNLITTKATKTASGAKPANGLSLLKPFSCRGKLTGLVLGVDVRTESETRYLYPKISLRRQKLSDDSDDTDDTDDSGGSLVKVSGSQRTVRLTPGNISTSGAFDYPLDPPLDFRANDVLAWNQPDLEKSVVRMYTVNVLLISSSDDDDSPSFKSVLLLYPVTGKVEFYTHLKFL